jgi:hypothetical protein
MQPRAAGVSPPWFGNAIATCTAEAVTSGASILSPPWFGNAIATAHVSHGWLTPAALGACDDRSLIQCACGDGKARTSTPQKRACNRERRASARRGSVTQLQRRTFSTAGSRQPLLVLRMGMMLAGRPRMHYVSHGWLTPAALDCGWGCCWRAARGMIPTGSVAMLRLPELWLAGARGQT